MDQAWERIGVTGNHPLWSEDRHDYVAAMDLRVGERLKNLSGDTVWVQQKLPRPGPTPVYNLEVQDEHVYYVGANGVLAHNAGDFYDSKNGDEYLYRGVSGFYPPQLDEALRGTARPRGTRDDPQGHHGGLTEDSALTSWDTDPRNAIDSALDGAPGVVLRIRLRDIASDRLRRPRSVISEDTEVMIKGLIENADVIDVYDLIRQFGQ